MFKTPPITTSTKKAEATRARIVDVALDLFRRQGFEQTTMRGIAAEAGVSLGSAYYYFESKEDLVMAFYERAIEAMTPRMEAALAGADSFEGRIAAIMNVKFEYFRPNRSFLGALFRHAADPQNRLSPFSEATRQIRERDQVYFARAIEAKSGEMRVPEDLAPYLPQMLWLYQMGLILYWIYDRSPDQRRTQQLLEKSLSLMVSGLKVARFALLKPLRLKIVELILLAEGGNERG
ncbi:MAG: TetR family transcriptional regulator [Terracidiphilus sp.]